MAAPAATLFPTPLDAYPLVDGGVLATLSQRIAAEPFNAVATGIFALAIIHTFAVKRFLVWAHHLQAAHEAREQAAGRPPSPGLAAPDDRRPPLVRTSAWHAAAPAAGRGAGRALGS
jgi:hypothetical protein